VLADLVRTDRHNHRQVAGDSDLAEAVKVVARAHQSAVWSRQRQVNALRSALREYYPAALAAFGTDLAAGDAVAVLALAPTPDAGRALSRTKIASALRRAGRQRNIDRRAAEIATALRADYLQAPPAVAAAPTSTPSPPNSTAAPARPSHGRLQHKHSMNCCCNNRLNPPCH
jgi:hypothetical protein